MADAQSTLAAPAAVRRADYLPPDWLVPEVTIDFDLAADRTIVQATLQVERNGTHQRAIRLDGEGLELIDLKVDGKPFEPMVDDGDLIIELTGPSAMIETVVA